MLVAPVEILGRELSSNGFTKTVPKSWSDAEVAWAAERRGEGFSVAEVAEALGRSEVSVSIKLKRASKATGEYNVRFRDVKYEANERFLSFVKPVSVLDAFAGDSWWRGRADVVVTNDVDERFDVDYHLPAFDLLCDVYRGGDRFDVVDLDPFGSAYECFDFAVRVARRGVVVSFGEWGHKRWKRTDFVGPRYGVDNVDDFVPERFVAEFQRVARLHKKSAVVFDSLQYAHFFRVYFLLEERKEFSQWD
jgi:hypothetical protein